MPGDGEDAIGLDQKPEGTGKPDRSASAPRHRVGVAGWDSTPCMSGLGKNNASGADRAGSVWLVAKLDIEKLRPAMSGQLLVCESSRHNPRNAAPSPSSSREGLKIT